jgi:hypothetical protein
MVGHWSVRQVRVAAHARVARREAAGELLFDEGGASQSGIGAWRTVARRRLRPGPDDVEHDDPALVDQVDDQAPVPKRPRVELGRVAWDMLSLPGITTELLDHLGERASASS